MKRENYSQFLAKVGLRCWRMSCCQNCGPLHSEDNDRYHKKLRLSYIILICICFKKISIQSVCFLQADGDQETMTGEITELTPLYIQTPRPTTESNNASTNV